MRFDKTKIEGCFSISPDVYEDERGGFYRVFCEEEIKEFAGDIKFVQINHSMNKLKGTFRGLHYQIPPHIEDKLIRCVSGKVIDIFLDLRTDSPTFLQYDFLELSETNRRMVFLCKGIAHGFLTLEDNTQLIYHHTQFYNKESERGVRYDDPQIQLELPVDINVISTKDLQYDLLPNGFNGLEI